MDRKYIEQERIVQRYLSGELTVREARDFEQYCLEHPEILKDMPIPVRLKARLARRPLEASETGMFPAIPSSTSIAVTEATEEGFDPDEEEADVRRIYGVGPSRGMMVTLLVALIAAIGAAVWFAYQARTLSKQIGSVQHEWKNAQAQPAGSFQSYSLELSRNGVPAQPSLAIGWPQPPILLDIHVKVADSKFNLYQVTIDSENAGRVLQLHRLARDSNGELRFALNSSAFGPGTYTLKFEGYTWRGQTVEQGWLKLSME